MAAGDSTFEHAATLHRDAVRAGGRDRVCVIGAANIDVHGLPHAALRLRDSNPGTIGATPGGVARNIAENLARLGVETRLITALGCDHYGDVILQQAADAGIDVRFVRRLDTARTGSYVAVLDESGDMRVAIADMDIMNQLGADALQPLADAIAECPTLIVDANLCDSALHWLAERFRDHAVFADTVSEAKAVRLQPYLGTLHTLKTSPAEARALTGLEAQTEAQLDRLADWVHGRGVPRLFVTRGRDGLFYSTPDERGIVPRAPLAGDIRNTSGAGDAFLAALAYAWLQDWSLRAAIQFALAAAQITVADASASSAGLSLHTVTSLIG